MTMPTQSTADATDLQSFSTEYGVAWETRDVDAILAFHAPDGTFRMHAPGYEPAIGADAVREAFVAVLAQLPDVCFEERRTLFGEGFYVFESTMTGTLASPVELEGETVDGTGQRVSVDCLDVVEVRDGLITSKETYLDGLTFAAQLGLLA
jgi:ketosteroid isomerase-like protein